MYLGNTMIQKDKCIRNFITSLFITAKTLKQPRCPSAEKWIRKLWYIYTMDYFSTIKKSSNEVDETGAYYTEWIKSERKTPIQYINALYGISVQFSSVAQLCLTLCNHMNCSTPGLPVHHRLPEFTQTHVHPVSDAIQPSHPLSSPSPLAPNLSQHQSLFQWVNSLHEVAKVLELQL